MRYAPDMRLRLGIVLGLVSVAAHAEIYTWTDANGQVRYSDQPPLNQTYSVREVRPTPAANSPSDPATDPDHQMDDPRADTSSASGGDAQTAVDPAALKAQCDRARERIAFYERTPAVRVLYENESGETVRMTPEERSSRLSHYRDLAAESCQ